MEAEALFWGGRSRLRSIVTQTDDATMDYQRLEERVRNELQKQHQMGPHLLELRKKQGVR